MIKHFIFSIALVFSLNLNASAEAVVTGCGALGSKQLNSETLNLLELGAMDYTCFNNCLAEGHMMGYCRKICSY